MAKVYLSFLGTNDYLPCTYFFGDREVAEVRFVQEATVSLFCQDWGPQDRILIFTTAEAYRKNWLDDGHEDRDGQPMRRQGLAARLARLGLQAQITQVDIPEGKNEDEIWQIFDILLRQQQSQDETVFDITHAFRSIPMLAMVALNYAKAMRQVSLQGIYYGAFEVLGNIRQVEKMPLQERRVPVFDLTAFDRLLEWSTAIDRFLGAGDAGPASKLAKAAVQPVLRQTQGRDEAAQVMNDLANQLHAFSRAAATCRGPRLGVIMEKLKEKLEQALGLQVVPPFKPLLERIQTRISTFDGDPILDGIRVARWCLEHNLIQQGFTLLQEFLVSFLANGSGLDHRNLEDRDISSQAVKIFALKLEQPDWNNPARGNPEKTKAVLALLQSYPELAKVFETLRDYRNDLNHAAFVEKKKNKKKQAPIEAERFPAKLAELLTRVESVIGKRG